MHKLIFQQFIPENPLKIAQEIELDIMDNFG